MRIAALLLMSAIAAGAAHAQPAGAIGPSFAPASIKPDNFDTVFDVKVTTTPAVVVLRNQTAEARWDAVVCNPQVAKVTARGAVRVDPTARWGYLDPGPCTMFTNFRNLDLATVEADEAWTARVYLRSHR